jgi:hypothetical protein
LVFLALTANELFYTIPPTYGTLINLLLAGVLGTVLTVTGVSYFLVAGADAGFLLSDTGLSLSVEPQSGRREWIPFERVVRAKITPWSMSPWLKKSRFVELELEAKEADMTCTDTFVVRLPDDDRSFLDRLKSRLGDRLEISPRVATAKV